MQFCPNCSSILQKNVESENAQNNLVLKHICYICLWEKEAAPEDTIMASISLKEEQSLYKSEIYLNAAGKDKIAPIVKKDCTQCDNTRLKKVHIISTGETVFVCPKCDNRFLNQ